MFHFDMVFPPDYPHNAPKVSVTTTSGAQVRFNPNLYAGGKVCLSILGTWRAEHSGEQWSAVQSVQSVLLSIQSLLNDAPYHNEPSFEADDGSGDPQRYNDKILHETLRVAVCEVMEETLRLDGSEAAEHHCISRNGRRLQPPPGPSPPLGPHHPWALTTAPSSFLEHRAPCALRALRPASCFKRCVLGHCPGCFSGCAPHARTRMHVCISRPPRAPRSPACTNASTSGPRLGLIGLPLSPRAACTQACIRSSATCARCSS